MSDWTPTHRDIAWTWRLIQMMNEGGVWGQPGSGAIFVFYHSKKEFTLDTALVTDQETVDRTVKVLGLLGWKERKHVKSKGSNGAS